MHNKVLDVGMHEQIQFDHGNVPKELHALNVKLLTALDCMDVMSSEVLAEIVIQRAVLVENLLSKLLMNRQQQAQMPSESLMSDDTSDPTIDVAEFAKAEYAINQALERRMMALKKSTHDDMVSLSKGRKAIGEYTGHNVKFYKRTSTPR